MKDWALYLYNRALLRWSGFTGRLEGWARSQSVTSLHKAVAASRQLSPQWTLRHCNARLRRVRAHK